MNWPLSFSSFFFFDTRSSSILAAYSTYSEIFLLCYMSLALFAYFKHINTISELIQKVLAEELLNSFRMIDTI